MRGQNPRQGHGQARRIGLLTMIPAVLAAGPIVGFLVGSYLDQRVGTGPWLMIFFLVLGGISGVRQTISLVTKAGEGYRDGG